VNKKILGLLFFAAAIHSVQTLQAQGTAFMYQGRLNDGGSPANGIYDLRFAVFDAVTNGNAVSGSLTNLSVPASNGLFVVTLDFGTGIFTGTDRWLDIAVRAVGVTNFTVLFPRQQLTPTPYAIFANSASNLVGNLAAAQLTGTLPGSAFAGFTNSVILTNGANSFSGTFSGNGTNLVNLNAAQLTGGTVADARLSTNVALLNANQTFSGANNFTNFGNSFIGSFFGNGLVGWIPTNDTAIQAQIDHGYLLTNSQVVTVTLPTNANAGDIVRISGAGAGGWIVAQVTNQSVLGNFLNFGKTWSQSGASPELFTSIASSSDGTKLAATANGSSGTIYISSDSGKTWTITSPNGISSAAWSSIASSADGTKLVAAVNSGSIYTSTNSGASWTLNGGTSSASWSAVASSSDGAKLVATVNGGGIYTNSGSNWNISSAPSSKNWISIASSSDGSKCVAAISGGLIYTNSGKTWAPSSAPSSSWTSVASSSDGTRLAAAISGGVIYTSTNSGASWVTNNLPNASWNSVAISGDGSKLVATISGGGIYASANWGMTWTQQTNAPAASWSAITSSSDGGTLAAAINNSSGGGIYISTASSQSSSTTGTNGYISGVQGSAVELQCIGGNQWMPVSSAGTIWAH
jgi:photosystem II stability/assembly factor-like uncharacterized protein